VGGVPRQIVAGIAQHYKPEESSAKDRHRRQSETRQDPRRRIQRHALGRSDDTGLSVLTVDPAGCIGSGAGSSKPRKIFRKSGNSRRIPLSRSVEECPCPLGSLPPTSGVF
jgi:hypothetical protein